MSNPQPLRSPATSVATREQGDRPAPAASPDSVVRAPDASADSIAGAPAASLDRVVGLPGTSRDGREGRVGELPRATPLSPRPGLAVGPHRQPRRHTGALIAGLVVVTALVGLSWAVRDPSASQSGPGALTAPAPDAGQMPGQVAADTFPPATLADFLAFAATGDPSAIHQFDEDSVGDARCPWPNVYATVDPQLTGRELAADAAAFAVAHRMLDNPCRAALLIFHRPAENTGDGFTAGRIFLDGNPGGKRHTIRVDIGAESGEFTELEVSFSVPF